MPTAALPRRERFEVRTGGEGEEAEPEGGEGLGAKVREGGKVNSEDP